MKVKNWAKFQHYNKPNPAWLKLYRGLLDDIYYHSLSPLAGKYLPLLWLVCCETDGELPPLSSLAFRLRMEPKQLKGLIGEWSHFLEGDSRVYLEQVYSESMPERERETETEREDKKTCAKPASKKHSRTEYPEALERLWKIHPYGTKAEANEALKKLNGSAPPIEELETILSAQVTFANGRTPENNRAPMKHLCRWLKYRGWESGIPMAKHERVGPGGVSPGLEQDDSQYGF